MGKSFDQHVQDQNPQPTNSVIESHTFFPPSTGSELTGFNHALPFTNTPPPPPPTRPYGKETGPVFTKPTVPLQEPNVSLLPQHKVFKVPDKYIDGATLDIPLHCTAVHSQPRPARLSTFPVLPGPQAFDASSVLPRPPSAQVFHSAAPQLARIYDTVSRIGVPNYRGSRVRVPSSLKIEAWRRVEHILPDRSLVDCLEFGFPAGFTGGEPPSTGAQNHASARGFPSHVSDYLEAELRHKAMAGPFPSHPFQNWFRTNPAMTRPKRDSETRRVILDLSFPQGHSVNSHVPVEALDGAAFKLHLPTPTDFAHLIRKLGKGCLMYKVDLSRAYRQLRSDPMDWPLLGIEWDQQFYMDTAVPFGLRHGASACQRTTEAVVAVAADRHEAEAYPYIDDTAGAAVPSQAEAHFHGLLDTMEDLGLDAAPHKSQPPSVVMTWVGVTFNSIDMTMAIEAAKVQEALELCDLFLAASSTSLKNMQSFMGKIYHVAKCSAPARRFTSRLQDLLRRLHTLSPQSITSQARLDALWFRAFLPLFNGVSLIKSETADLVVQVDACLQGAGGICAEVAYYHFQFPIGILSCHFSIAALECLNILVACRLWCQRWAGQHVLLYSYSWSSVCALHSGSAEDPLMRAIRREVWWLTAVHDVDLVIRHRPGVLMCTANTLSRASLSEAHARRLTELLRDVTEPRVQVPMALLFPPFLI